MEVDGFAIQLAAVESAFTLRDRSRVVDFLRANPCLFPLLPSLSKAVDDAFGEGTNVALRVACYGAPWLDDELEVLIQTSADADDALARLHAFDDAWLMDHDDQANGKLSAHIEYV